MLINFLVVSLEWLRKKQEAVNSVERRALGVDEVFRHVYEMQLTSSSTYVYSVQESSKKGVPLRSLSSSLTILSFWLHH